MSDSLRRYSDLVRLHERGRALESVQPALFAGQAEPWARVVREISFSDIDARADFEKAAYTFTDPSPLARDIQAALAAVAQEVRSTIQRMTDDEAYLALLHLIYIQQAKTQDGAVALTIASLAAELGVDEDTVARWIERAIGEGAVVYAPASVPGAPETVNLTEEGLARAADPVLLAARPATAPTAGAVTATATVPLPSGPTVAHVPEDGGALDDVRARLHGTDWIPFRELGRGGGGVVYLCANRGVLQAFDAYADVIRNLHKPRPGQGAQPPSGDAALVLPTLLERVLEAVRDRNAIAAVKIPYADPTGRFDPERFRREVAAMRTYNHPALIRLIDSDPRTPPEWVAVEFHSRGALEEEENRSRYLGQPLAALRDVRPVAEALGHVHRGSSIHRDVKPKNIFVADDGRLVLGDFGIVLPESDATQLTGVEPAHSRDWVPDWVRFGEERTYTAGVDVFALAKVIFYLIAGKNVMASQLSTELQELRKKYPDAPGLDATLVLLEKGIVLHEEDAVFVDAAAFTQAIDDILAQDHPAPRDRLLFSFQVAADTSHLELAPAREASGKLPGIRGLAAIRVRLGGPTRWFEASARLYGGAGVVGFRLGGKDSEESSFAGSTTTSPPGDWTAPITLRCDEPLGAGWHDLLVTGIGKAVSLSGFVLYAAG